MNRSDLDYIFGNLQQPPLPPAPPPPPSDAAADRARLIVVLDGLAQMGERHARQEMMAQQNVANLAAQRVETPAQQIIHHHHMPAPQQPIIAQPDMSSTRDMVRLFCMTKQ